MAARAWGEIEIRCTDQSRHIYSRASLSGRSLQATSHSEELIDLREVILGVPLRDSLYKN